MGNLKDSIRSFAADYSRRLKLDMLAEQRSIKDKLDRAVLAGDSGQVNIARANLACWQVKEHQALVVRARLKRMSCKAMNMAQGLVWFVVFYGISTFVGTRIMGRGTQACG